MEKRERKQESIEGETELIQPQHSLQISSRGDGSSEMS